MLKLQAVSKIFELLNWVKVCKSVKEATLIKVVVNLVRSEIA